MPLSPTLLLLLGVVVVDVVTASIAAAVPSSSPLSSRLLPPLLQRCLLSFTLVAVVVLVVAFFSLSSFLFLSSYEIVAFPPKRNSLGSKFSSHLNVVRGGSSCSTTDRPESIYLRAFLLAKQNSFRGLFFFCFHIPSEETGTVLKETFNII